MRMWNTRRLCSSVGVLMSTENSTCIREKCKACYSEAIPLTVCVVLTIRSREKGHLGDKFSSSRET